MVRCLEIEEGRDRIIVIEKCSSLSNPKLSGGSRMDSDPYDDSQSDSGVSADFSMSSTFESPVAAKQANMDAVKPPANETPIDREIRRAVQREQSLRRSRGIVTNVSPTTEYVDIPLKKPVLYADLPMKSDKTSHGKDRQFAGKKMQKEIHTEVQREQALVRLGTVPGVYDKGTVRQLKERKQLFEAFQEPSKDSSSNLTPRTRASSQAAPANDLSPGENWENTSIPLASPPGGVSVGGRVDLLNQQQQQSPTSPTWTKPGGSTSSTSPGGPGLSDGNGCQAIILESNPPDSCSPYPPQQNRRLASLTQKQAVDEIDSGTSDASPSLGRGDHRGRTERELEEEEEEEEDAEEELVPKENPFFKLRSCLSVDKVEQDIREARERERELRRQRTNLYGAATGARRGGRGVNGGRGGQLSPCSSYSSPSFNRPPLPPAQPVSRTRRMTGRPSAVPQSLGRLGMWPPSQAEDKQVIQLESPRQKTPLLQHWETGLINNGHRDQD